MALRRMVGRSVIYTNESNITRDNVLQVLEEALRTHFKQSRRNRLPL
jgi:hypothetical protein